MLPALICSSGSIKGYCWITASPTTIVARLGGEKLKELEHGFLQSPFHFRIGWSWPNKPNAAIRSKSQLGISWGAPLKDSKGS
jgi:hypothetical protein